jgi:hypothetical protein
MGKCLNFSLLFLVLSRWIDKHIILYFCRCFLLVFLLCVLFSGEGQLVCKFGQPELENVSKTPLNVAKYPTGVDEKVKKCKGNSGSWWSWKNSLGKRILQP